MIQQTILKEINALGLKRPLFVTHQPHPFLQFGLYNGMSFNAIGW